MNIYFTASIAAKKQYLANYQKIIEFLQSHKHIVQSNHIMQNDEDSIRLKTREERLSFHKQLEEWISSSDCMIVEASFPSISVGYEISMALRIGKPVLILYFEGDPPSLFAHIDNDKIICEKYTYQTLPSLIEDFLTFAQTSAESRFTFFITPQIASFLDKTSRQQRTPKSVYLRKLIEREMKKS